MEERTAAVPVAGADLELYRRLVDASPVPIVVIAPDTTVHVWNPAAARLFGWSADEILGRPIPIVPESKRAECQDARDAVARGDRIVDMETFRCARDGRWIDVAISAVPLRAVDGADRILLVFEDLRERKRDEAARAGANRADEEALRRNAFLVEASAVLASSLDYATTLDHVARLAVSTLADYCVIDALGEHDRMRRVAAAHAHPEKQPLVQQLRDLEPSPYMTARVSHVIATGEPDVVSDLDLEHAASTIADPRRRALIRALGARSYIVVALRARGSTLGTMTFVSAESGRRYHRADVELARELGQRAGVALDNARLHESERHARTSAENAERRAAFLSRASAVLATSLEYDTTLKAVTELAVPYVADWCSIDVVEAGGTVRRVALAHGDPTKTEIAAAARIYPADPQGRHPRTHVLQTGRSVLIPRVDPAELAQVAGDEEHRRALQALAYRSVMIIAMMARGETIGAITFATTESGRTYDEDDVKLGEELARRAASAVDRARLYEGERQARAEAEAANRAKDEFLSTVSHELRTPLQAMLGWVAVLRQGKLGEAKAARALDIIEQSGRAQSRLIGDLLDVSRLATGRLRIEPRPVDLPPIVQAAVDAVQPAADAKRVRVRCLFDPRIGPVAGDPERLQQIVWNLLSNAVKFTPGGGKVELRLERDERDVRLVVTDTGRGIATEFLPYVFEPFRQAEDVRKRTRQGGVGLGLAIVRHLTELHGGRVAVESPGTGLGAAFTVVLPLLPVEQEAEESKATDGKTTHSHR
jgi:PAS domain S-box-containing protein